MQGNFPIVLDACVLASANVADLMLRLSLDPRLYLPRWSEKILQEAVSARQQLGYEPQSTIRWEAALRGSFPGSIVDYPPELEDSMRNDPKDRHVLAAAVSGRAEIIATFNLKDFPPAALVRWEVEAKHPDDVLTHFFELSGGVVTQRLNEIATKRGKPLAQILETLGKRVPTFSRVVAEELGIDLFSCDG